MAQNELSHMATELKTVEGVRNVEVTDNTNIVKFNIDYGNHNPLTSEAISVLGRYDCHVYGGPETGDDFYWAIAR